MNRKGKAVVVGGSIAGICSAHALIEAGWDVVVLEKTRSPPTGAPTGAGVGIDSLAQKIIQSWLNKPHLLNHSTLPMTIDQNQATSRGEIRILARDKSFNFRASLWADLHGLLYKALPSDVVQWGHFFFSFTVSDDKTRVTVKTKVLETGSIIDIVSDLLIAADGCLSSIRSIFLPDFKLRYSGYCAWRGVLDFSGNQHTDSVMDLKKAYPDLGNCVYFDLSSGTHSVLYELPNERINWIWYLNQPEPELEVWRPEFARIMRETREPFINVIYDADPLTKLFWDNVVLIGDAAHPTTPHGVRSTNMSILDAAVLGKCLKKHKGLQNLHLALQDYQSIRQPVVSGQVLHSRRLGRIKQGLSRGFDPRTASPVECEELQQKDMPFFSDVPLILNEN